MYFRGSPKKGRPYWAKKRSKIMDYKDLANLIFPDAKPIEFYEEIYPERDLREGAMVVRIGPSPTGSVHIGTINQA